MITTKLGLSLLLVSAAAIAAVAAELLYLLLYRPRRSPTDPELAGGGNDARYSSKELLLCLFRRMRRSRSRIEPTVASSPAAVKRSTLEAAAEEYWDLATWRAMCMGPSRVLYTIKEEEEEEEEVVIEIEETPFSTPCPSPEYYTPASSPTHAGEPGG